MKIEIRHTTRYQYMERIFLGPHLFRLTPRSTPSVAINRHALILDPQPVGSCPILETDGTTATFAWFADMTDTFTIEGHSIITSAPFNPFDFLIHPESCTRLPMVYAPEWLALLGPYLGTDDKIDLLDTLALDLLEESRNETVPFLMNLCVWICDHLTYAKREQGPPHPPLETLERREGSCRDFTVLAMAVCRQLGLACRYVSGYLVSDNEEESGELHGWFETFLPGAGWRGFDPSHGLACDQHHIALSACADPSLTLPITGTYRGATSSCMHVDLEIRTLS